MSEIFDYGFSPQEDVRGLSPTTSPPPLCIFTQGLDLLYDKIMNVLMQRSTGVFYDRNFKSELESVPFEQDSDETKEQIKNIIYTSLTTNIENLTIDNINIVAEKRDFGVVYTIEIRIRYNQKLQTLKLKLDKYGLTVG